MEVIPAYSPVPVFIDGLSSTLSYVMLAVKQGEDYNCVCLSNYRTLKFYPNYDFWGVTKSQLHSIGLDQTYARDPYQGVHNASSKGVEDLLNILRNQRGTAVVPTELLTGVFETNYSDRSRSRMLHPPARGYAPKALPTFDEVSKLDPGQLAIPADKPLMLAFG